MDKKNILFIINYLDLGGAGKMLKYVANLCVTFSKTVTVLTLYEQKRSNDLDSRIIHLSLNQNEKGGAIWRMKLILDLKAIIRQQDPDVVCSFVSDVCFTTRVATLGLKTIYVSAERGDPYTNTRLWDVLMKWTYRHSDYCFFQLSQARDYYGNQVAKKSFVIPNVFIQEEGITPYHGERKKTIVSAGRFVAEKRYEILISAFTKVHELHPEYKLILYGDGPFIEQYKQLAEKLGVSESIEYPGYVKGVARAIREDGIFVLSSRYEGIPNSLIEALSIGIPCVSTDCTPGGPRFLTKDGKNGLIVPVDDVESMTDAIIRIIENPQLAKLLETKAPEIVDELKDEVISKLWLDAFNQILEENDKH